MAFVLGAVEEDFLGRVVYRSFAPQALGRVVRCTYNKKDRYNSMVEVYWFKTKRTEVNPAYLFQDFEKLVLETEKKAKNHRAAYEKALKEIIT